MYKKRFFKRICCFLFVFLILAFYWHPNHTELIPQGMITFESFESNANYLIGQNYTKEGLFSATLVDAYIVNAQGELINEEHLPFECHFWVAENPSYGAIVVDTSELSRIKKHPIAGYKLKSRAFAIVMHLIPKPKYIGDDAFYLKLDYKVQGRKKHIVRCIMKPFTLKDDS